MMAVEGSVISKISVHSKRKSQNSKESPSTHTTESPQQNSSKHYDFTNCQAYWDQLSSSQQSYQLEKKIHFMEKNQLEMQNKFQKCIENMLAEIQRNNQNNARLATEVNSLKTEISESKKDILIIDEYIKTNLKRQFNNPRENNFPLSMNRPVPSRHLLGSCSGSKNILGRRTPSKLFKSKLLLKS